MTASEAQRVRLRRLSATLRELANRPEEALTFDDLVEAFGERAFAAIFLVFGILTAVSTLPGLTFVTGAPLVIVAWQLLRGREKLHLPAAIGNRKVKPADIGRMNARVLHHLRRAERLLAPRLSFMFSAIAMRSIGLLSLLLAVIVFLPIPLGNLLPGIAIAIIALALLTRDGLAALAGIAVGIAAILVLILVYGALLLALTSWLF